MKKQNQYNKICGMMKEKALAHLEALYKKADLDEAQNAAKANALDLVEKLINPENVAAFCERNGITYGAFKAFFMAAPFLITPADALEIIKALEDEKG